MKASPESLDSLPERLGWALLHSLWQGAIIAVALVILLSLLRRSSAALRHAVCLVALLALPACFAFTLALSDRRPLPTKPLPPSWETAAVNRPLPNIEPPVNQFAIRSTQPAFVKPPIANTPFHPQYPWKFRREDWFPRISWLWAAGVCLLSLHRLGAWREIRRLRRSAAPARTDLQEVLRRLQKRFSLHRVVRLLESVEATTPMLVGLVAPTIILPVEAITGLTVAELEAVIAHELAHLFRRDAWSNLALLAVETLFFYHPAVWWISRNVRDEREMAADDLALSICRDRWVYVGALYRLAEMRYLSALALAASGGNLLGRIRRLVQPSAPEPAASNWGAPLIVGTLLACVVCAARVHAQQETKPITVQPTESLQSAIDAAAPGTVIHLEPGEWRERIVISKPLTLEGAGWGKSRIKPDAASANPAEQSTITICDAATVAIRKLQLSDGVEQKHPSSDSLITLHHAEATVEDCAFVGPAQNGLRIADASAAKVVRSLITSLANYGIEVADSAGVASGGASRLQLFDSEVRYVDVAAVSVGPGSGETLIERNRISGGHAGISYDNASPTITGNTIFNNRVSGVSASGATRAVVRENLFWKNIAEITCGLNSRDAVEGNTFIGMGMGIRITTGARPVFTRNLFFNYKWPSPARQPGLAILLLRFLAHPLCVRTASGAASRKSMPCQSNWTPKKANRVFAMPRNTILPFCRMRRH